MNVTSSVYGVVAHGIASLRELDDLGVEDLYDLLEIALVKQHNIRLAEEAASREAQAKG